MFKSHKLTATILLASALGAFSASAAGPSGPSSSAQTRQLAQADDEWKENEVHASYSHNTKRAIVDVNDEFILSSSSNDAGMVLRVGVLDGTRAKYGECGSGTKPKLGEAQTTWLSVAYSKPDQNGVRNVAITRTVDFFGRQRTYSFQSKGGWERATLEPGISVEINDGVLSYSQSTGPLGTSGNTKSIDLAYELSERPETIRSAISLNSSSWFVATEGSASAPTYRVNNHAVIASLPDQKVQQPATAQRAIVPPVEINVAAIVRDRAAQTKMFHRVQFEGDQKEQAADDITGVETNDIDEPTLPCPAVRCRNSLDCFAGLGSYCTCAYVISGGGVCLI